MSQSRRQDQKSAADSGTVEVTFINHGKAQIGNKESQASDLKRRLKEAEAALDAKAYAKYPKTSDSEINSLVVDGKWFADHDGPVVWPSRRPKVISPIRNYLSRSFDENSDFAMIAQVSTFEEGIRILEQQARQFPGGLKEVVAFVTGPQQTQSVKTGSIEIGGISTRVSTWTTDAFQRVALTNNLAKLEIRGQLVPAYARVHVQPKIIGLSENVYKLLSLEDITVCFNRAKNGELASGVLAVTPGGAELASFLSIVAASTNPEELARLQQMIKAEARGDILRLQLDSFSKKNGIFTFGPPSFVGPCRQLSHMVIPRTFLSLSLPDEAANKLDETIRPDGMLTTNIALRTEGNVSELGIEFVSRVQPEFGIFNERKQFVPVSKIDLPNGKSMGHYLTDEVIDVHFKGRDRDSIIDNEIANVIEKAGRGDKTINYSTALVDGEEVEAEITSLRNPRQ